MAEREVIQDPNAPNRGNAPAQQLAVSGIMSPRAAPAADNSLSNAIASFGGVAKKLDQKRKNASFIDGQMAAMSGKTQAEVAASGNRTTMAGFVGMEVTNAVSEWGTAQQLAASSEHYGMDPAAYNKMLSEEAGKLIAQVGDDDYAQETLAKALAPTMQRLAAAQSGSHAAYVEQETLNTYTNGLFLSGQYSAAAYQDPVTGETSKGGDYRAFAQGMIGTLIGVESGGVATAKNPNSSAEGLGQFIDSTWLTTVKRYSPTVAAGKSNAEILAMKTNPTLARRMAIEYAAEQARGLAASGLPVTPGNTYLSYFAGPGGAKRVLRGDPSAPVSTTLTQGQINANKGVLYKGGRLITNAELQGWAARKMGAKAAPSAATRTAILTNPGLPPEKHRAAVTAAMVSSMTSGDMSLFQSAGGLEGLKELNLSMAQINSITAATKVGLEKSQNDYNMQYEKDRHDFLTQAASGDFTEEEMFEKLAAFQGANGMTDTEKRRLHQEMQRTIDKVDANAATKALADLEDADKAQQEAADAAWNSVDAQIEVIGYKEAVKNGTMTADQAIKELVEIGELKGASKESTEKVVAKILSAYETVQGKERTRMETAIKDGQAARVKQEAAARLLGKNALGTGSSEEQAAGIKVLEQALRDDMDAAGLSATEQAEKGPQLMAQALVQNDVIDKERASTMRAAMISPVGPDGKPTPAAIQSMAFFMDLKHSGNASPEYLAKMFSGQEKTLEMFLTAEEHMVGDAGLDDALAKAHEQITNPVTQARISAANKMIDKGSVQELTKDKIIEASGLDNTVWNGVMNLLNPNWHSERLDTEGKERIMADTGLDLVIEQSVRSMVSLYPNASEGTIAQLVAGDVAKRGAVIGGSFVMSPTDKSVREVMGLNSKEPTAPNDAAMAYIMEHGREMFGDAVMDDIGPGIMQAYFSDLGVDLYEMGTKSNPLLPDLGNVGAMRDRAVGAGRAEVTVEMLGDLMIITPTSKDYEGLETIPEAASFAIPAKEVGKWFNANQTRVKASPLNTAVDLLKPVDTFGNRFIVNPLRSLVGRDPLEP